MIITLKIQQFQELYGYFDLVVDTSEVNLAVRYTVTATNATTSDIADLKIVGYSFPGQQNYITYLATETLNDSQDTQIALNNGKAIVEAHVLFEQLVN